MTNSPQISHEYAPDETIRRQIKLWGKNELIDLIANAMPTGVLILNQQRQAVFANDLFLQIVKLDSFDQILGKRPGNILSCVNAELEETGCGSSLFCKNCGALRAITSSFFGTPGLEECLLRRSPGLSSLELRVKTTPTELNGEQFTIFAIEDIGAEKERDALMNKLKTMSETDELTGLHNRRYLYQEARREMARANRYNFPLAFFMIDIDHFKKVNDTYGHLVGDQVLVAFAKTILASVRKIDRVVRWGGEEFIVLLPETDTEQACIAARRIQRNVTKMRIPTNDGEVGITISIGTTGIKPGEETTFDELIKEADDALYQAKEAGRNCIVHSRTKKTFRSHGNTDVLL